MIKNTFADRMTAQRAVLKAINKHSWPNEQLHALSEEAIRRWISENQLRNSDNIVGLARETSEVLLFAASSSQEQISEAYTKWSADMKTLLNQIESEIKSL